jgi:molybdopterin-guanine dinucleotide biosynthesis protein A
MSMQISAVILAGGEGTRLGGVDKGLIEFKGRKMIEWTLDIVRPCVSQLLISCNRNITDYMPLGDSVVCDRIAGSLGPLAGIHAALESLTGHAEQEPGSDHGLLVLPCDTPLVNSDIVERLLDAARKSPDSIVLLVEGDLLHPLHAVIPVMLKQNLEDYLIDGGRAVRKWYMQHKTVEVKLTKEEQNALSNVNTKGELDLAVKSSSK